MLIEELVAVKLRVDPKRPYPHPSSLVALHCGLEDVLQGLVLLTAATYCKLIVGHPLFSVATEAFASIC